MDIRPFHLSDRLKLAPRDLVVDPNGRIRFFWRALIFYCAGTWLLFPLFNIPFGHLTKWLDVTPGLSAGTVALGESESLLVALICTAAFAFYERRRIDTYGLKLARTLFGPAAEGTAVGGLFAALVGVGMVVFGAMQVHGLSHLDPTAIALYALQWFGANILVGLAEEAFYRGYLQQALWRSIGFWPAAIVIALVFAADHYFYKPGENLRDMITIVSFSLLMSYTLLRTGTLWFAVGFHFAFDFMQLFVIGTPNGGQVPVHRLLNVTFQGPAWLNGGSLGAEASVLVYPLMVIAWGYAWWRFRGREPVKAPRANEQGIPRSVVL